jgi:hypothetical protein
MLKRAQVVQRQVVFKSFQKERVKPPKETAAVYPTYSLSTDRGFGRSEGPLVLGFENQKNCFDRNSGGEDSRERRLMLSQPESPGKGGIEQSREEQEDL